MKKNKDTKQDLSLGKSASWSCYEDGIVCMTPGEVKNYMMAYARGVPFKELKKRAGISYATHEKLVEKFRDVAISEYQRKIKRGSKDIGENKPIVFTDDELDNLVRGLDAIPLHQQARAKQILQDCIADANRRFGSDT